MRHCMIDIETLATDRRATILQIGAVEFDPFVVGAIGTRFEAAVAVKGQGAKFGRVADIETIGWWLDDTSRERIFRRLLKGGQPLGKALHEFSEWYKGTGMEAIWANSPTFDLAILRSAYEDVKHPVPWHYREERDFRTLMRVVWEMGVRAEVPASGLSGLPTHDALGDAWRQARFVQEAYAGLASCRGSGVGVGGVDNRPVGVVESGAPAGTGQAEEIKWRWRE